MADYTEKQLLDIAVTGVEQVEASVRAFMDLDEAERKAAVGVYDFAVSAKDAATPAYDLAHSVETVTKKAVESRPGLSAVDLALEEIAESARRASAQMTTVATASAGVSAAARNAGGGMASYQQNIQGLGYALNDFFSVQGSLSQRLNAIANNMPMLLAGFGGLGLALSALLPIIGMVIQNWDHLAKMFGIDTDAIKDHVEKLKDRLKELEDKPVKLAVDVHEIDYVKDQIDYIKAALAAFEKFGKTRTKFEKESGKAIEEQVAEEGEGGGEGVRGRLRQQFVREQEQTNIELNEARKKRAEIVDQMYAVQARIDDLNKKGMVGMAREVETRELAPLQNAAEKEAEKARKAMAEITKHGGTADIAEGAVYKEATEGTGAKQLAGQRELARRLRETKNQRDAALALAVEASTPELMEHYEASAEDKKGADERAKQKEQDEKKQAAAAETRTTALDHLVTQAIINGKSVEEAAALRAQFDAEEAKTIQKETERLKEEHARGKALEANRHAMLAMGRTEAEIDKTQTRFEGMPTPVIQEHTTAVKEEKARDDAIKAAKAAGVAVDPGDSTEAIKAKTEAAKEQARGEKKEDTAAGKLARELSGKTDVDEQAQALVSQVRNQGGVYDPARDRVVRMSPEQQQRYIRNAVFDYLRQSGMGGQYAQAAAGPLAARAWEADDMSRIAAVMPQPKRPRAEPIRRVGPRRPNEGNGFRSVPPSGPADNATPQLIQVTAKNQEAIAVVGNTAAVLTQQVAQLRANAGMLGQDARRVNRRAQSVGETALSYGGRGS